MTNASKVSVRSWLESRLDSRPVELINGLPVLIRHLQWSENLPAVVMGAYAMLEVSSL